MGSTGAASGAAPSAGSTGAASGAASGAAPGAASGAAPSAAPSAAPPPARSLLNISAPAVLISGVTSSVGPLPSSNLCASASASSAVLGLNCSCNRCMASDLCCQRASKSAFFFAISPGSALNPIAFSSCCLAAIKSFIFFTSGFLLANSLNSVESTPNVSPNVLSLDSRSGEPASVAPPRAASASRTASIRRSKIGLLAASSACASSGVLGLNWFLNPAMVSALLC